jgi:hypothetical protein
MWSRLGTPIPPEVRRADGSQYESGTVWELEDALQAKREVWVYRRTEVPSIELNDPKFEQKRTDFAAVERFLQQFTNPDRSLKSGCNTYARAADFARLFEKHIESFVRKRFELQAAAPAFTQPAPASAGNAKSDADLTISGSPAKTTGAKLASPAALPKAPKSEEPATDAGKRKAVWQK